VSKDREDAAVSVTILARIDEAASLAIADLLGVAAETEPYQVGGRPVYRLTIRNRRIGHDVVLLLWPALNRADIRIGDCTMVFKSVSAVELYPGIEVLFRRADPPGHLFMSVEGRAEMVV
jgi:hypothetical protein